MIEFISRLPQGYQEVEYIESSGTQYIDTGVKPNQDTGVTIDFQLTNVSSWQCIFGAANSIKNTDEYGVWHTGTQYGFYYASTNVTAGVDATTRHQFVCSKNSLSIDGTTYSSPAYTNFTTNYNLILGAVNYAGNINYSAPIKLYSAKVYANGVLVRDFIPCKKSDGTVGLWDNVNSQFYTNAGSGTFTAGGNVGEVVITPGGIVSHDAALRRRMIQKEEEPSPTEATVSITGNTNKANYVLYQKTVLYAPYTVQASIGDTMTIYCFRDMTLSGYIYLNGTQVGIESYTLTISADTVINFVVASLGRDVYITTS